MVQSDQDEAARLDEDTVYRYRYHPEGGDYTYDPPNFDPSEVSNLSSALKMVGTLNQVVYK